MKEEITKMAREAGGHFVELPNGDAWVFGDEHIERFFHMAQAAEREAISDEWWMCAQSDLENGVKSLNEAAVEKWKKEYPELSKFGKWLEARGQE